MNASDRPNTCKSRGNRELAPLTTGARVSNAYATFPQDRDSPPKGGLIPNNVPWSHELGMKAPAMNDGDAFH